jgi:hypothetical protein
VATRRSRNRHARRLGALLAAAAANLAILAALTQPGHGLREPSPDRLERAVDISLMSWSPPRGERPAPPKSTPSATGPARETAAPAPSAPAASSPAPSPGVGIAPAAPSGALAGTLRRGDVGCAHPDAPWMSAADRDACRDRLAAGALNAPHLDGMAPEKLAYYAAVAKAQEDWRSGRDAGHPPFLFCGYKFGGGHVREVDAPPHALKLGPCYLEPPKGSLDIGVDIPMPGVATPDAVTPAGADPIHHIGQ